jgi:hypothetical protein
MMTSTATKAGCKRTTTATETGKIIARATEAGGPERKKQ